MNMLEDDIESLREKLYILIQNKELNNDSVIICSQKLDKRLVEYQKM